MGAVGVLEREKQKYEEMLRTLYFNLYEDKSEEDFIAWREELEKGVTVI